jgi:hypothetical protein
MSFNWISAFGRGVVDFVQRLVGGAAAQVMSARDWPSNHRTIAVFQLFDFEYLHIRRDNLGLCRRWKKV